MKKKALKKKLKRAFFFFYFHPPTLNLIFSSRKSAIKKFLALAGTHNSQQLVRKGSTLLDMKL